MVSRVTEDSHLLLNVERTKELVIDYRRRRTTLRPLDILDKDVELVDEYQYITNRSLQTVVGPLLKKSSPKVNDLNNY